MLHIFTGRGVREKSPPPSHEANVCFLVEILWGSLALDLLDRVSGTSFSTEKAARIDRSFRVIVLGAARIRKKVGEGRFD